MEKGKAYILGAGPGDFELLTLKAKRIIETADCIIYDRLINPKILGLVKKEAEKNLSRKRKYGGRKNSRRNQPKLSSKMSGGKKSSQSQRRRFFCFWSRRRRNLGISRTRNSF